MSPEPLSHELVEIEIGRLVLREHSVTAPQYIYLREVHGERSFSITIGVSEADEIKRVVTGQKTERPMTHQLMHDAITHLGAWIAFVDIVDMRQNTFYAHLILQDKEGNTLATLDARSSDSIALALRAKCPLRVTESVLEQVRTDDSQDPLPGDDPEDPPLVDEKPEAPDF